MYNKKNKFTITLAKDTNQYGEYWKSAPIQIADIIAQVGKMGNFVVWNPPDNTSNAQSIEGDFSRARDGINSANSDYENPQGVRQTSVGVWSKAGNKDGRDWSNYSSAVLDFGAVLSFLGTSDVRIYLYTNNVKDPQPDKKYPKFKLVIKKDTSRKQYTTNSSQDPAAQSTGNKY